MAAYLLDTNILSEIRKGSAKADKKVWQWWLTMKDAELFVSVLTIGEIRKGIERLASRDPEKKLILESWLQSLVSGFESYTIPISLEIANRWGVLQAIRPLPEIDALLAATALENDLTLVTRNEPDFEGLGVRLFNPFSH